MIFDVIRKQAGTLSKAILEGVMNAVDARATELRITLMPKWVELVDDGAGFKSKKDIYKFFETFGQPHAKEEQKVFGKFRMGRGQMFAFGHNLWETGRFVMDVDIKERGLDYTLTEVPKAKAVEGCKIRINLFDQLMPSDVDKTMRDLQLWCKWAPLKVYLNEQLISNDPEGHKWQHQTPEAYVSFKATGGLVIYNQGVFVMEIQKHRYGIGGEVVTRLGEDLDVNFARNDIIATCPVWKKISPFIDTTATARNVKKKTLDDDSRHRLANQICQGEELENAPKLKLITAVTGRHYAIDTLRGLTGYDRYSVAPRGNRLGDSLMKQKVAFIIAEETLERFGVKTGPELMGFLKNQFLKWNRDFTTTYIEFDTLTEGMDENYVPVKETDLRPNEKVWLELIKTASSYLQVDGRHIYGWSGRRIILGTSNVANGWTDGESYVAVERGYLASQDFNITGFCDVGSLMIHEACHDDLDMREHDHAQEFYEKFHDAVRVFLGQFVTTCVANLPSVVAKHERQMTKRALKDQDRVAKLAVVQSKSDLVASAKDTDEDEGGDFDELEDYFAEE
jgi:hypothetical protein